MSLDQIGFSAEDVTPAVEAAARTPKEYGQQVKTAEVREELPDVEAGIEAATQEPNKAVEQTPVPMVQDADGKHYPQPGSNPLFQKDREITRNTVAGTTAAQLAEMGITDAYGFISAIAYD